VALGPPKAGGAESCFGHVAQLLKIRPVLPITALMSQVNIQLGRGSSRSVVGRIFLSLFFLVFFGMGLLFTAFIVRQTYIDARTYSWPKTECVILESGVHDKGGNSPYEFRVHYQYEWKGHTYSSHRFKTQNRSFSDYSAAQRLVEKFRHDTKAVCYVDPRNPSQAILEHSSLWLALMIFLPLIFVAVGGGGIYVVWRQASAPGGPAPISLKPKALKTQKPMVAFCSLFILIGLLVFYAIFIRPVIKIADARHWPAVPCTVVSSRVQSHDSDDGTTYSVDILYKYEINGHEYKANRYHFLGGSSSGYRGKARIVREHPPGRKMICYVNPKDPTDAVVQRGFSRGMWFGLLPLLFVLAGAAGIAGALRKGKATQKPAAGTTSSPAVLKARYSPAMKFVRGLCMSLFWNGIVSVFIWLNVQMWMGRERGPKWFLTIFLIPFVLVGVGIIWMTIHAFFGLFSPRAQLRIESDTVALGDSVEVHWQFAGRVEKIREFRLLLEGREERDEGTGKSQRTNTEVFYTGDIVHLTEPKSVQSGSALCTVPTDKMSSDSEGDRRIVWVIRLKARIDRGADLNDEYPLTVTPSAATQTGLSAFGHA
jgi:hypothetical protein